jgi:hypothetical protein
MSDELHLMKPDGDALCGVQGTAGTVRVFEDTEKVLLSRCEECGRLFREFDSGTQRFWRDRYALGGNSTPTT